METNEKLERFKLRGNEIVDKWLNDSFIKRIFNDYDQIAKDKLKQFGLWRFWLLLSIYEWDENALYRDHYKMVEFVKLLNDNNATLHEFIQCCIIFKKIMLDSLVMYVTDDVTEVMRMMTIYDSRFLMAITIYDNILTEKLNLLEEYKKLLDISSMVVKCSNKFEITYMNNRFLKMSWFEESSLIWESFEKLFHEDNTGNLKKDIFARLELKKTWKWSFICNKADGTHFWVTTKICPIFDSKWETHEIVALMYFNI